MTMRDGWVSVDERLPGSDTRALVWTCAGECIVALRGDGEWYAASDGYMLGFVTHWQPIEGPGDGDE